MLTVLHCSLSMQFCEFHSLSPAVRHISQCRTRNSARYMVKCRSIIEGAEGEVFAAVSFWCRPHMRPLKIAYSVVHGYIASDFLKLLSGHGLENSQIGPKTCCLQPHGWIERSTRRGLRFIASLVQYHPFAAIVPFWVLLLSAQGVPIRTPDSVFRTSVAS